MLKKVRSDEGSDDGGEHLLSKDGTLRMQSVKMHMLQRPSVQKYECC